MMMINFLHRYTSFLIMVCVPLIYSFPCPPECICKPTEAKDVDAVRMSYTIDCSHVPLKNHRLQYHAESWSIHEDRQIFYDDPDAINLDYLIALDLSNSLSLKSFGAEAIQLTGATYLLQNLSLASQSNEFQLLADAFNADFYRNLKLLNLSSCCQKIPIQCARLFIPLKELQVLDLSGSDMYKTCLSKPDTISSTLRDLILQNNDYDMASFSPSNHVFDSVRFIPGELDLKYSRFQLKDQSNDTCLFNVFDRVSRLDLSSIQFQSGSLEENLKRLILCDNESTRTNSLTALFLRGLKLERLPSWMTNSLFPKLALLDLSKNFIRAIDLHSWTSLQQISLAFNPIEWETIQWCPNMTYRSINLRSTVQNRSYDVEERLQQLFRVTTDIDYSENYPDRPLRIDSVSIVIDAPKDGISLQLSLMNIIAWELSNASKLETISRLDLSHNRLTRLNLEKQHHLSYLQCSNQSLTKLILSKENRNLIELNCSWNALTTVEHFSSMEKKALKLIDLSYNVIDDIQTLFSNLHSQLLESVHLQSNRITRIPSKTFHRGLVSLYSIDLSNNRIDSIENEAFQAPNLQILDLTGNGLKTVESHFLSTGSLRLFYLINHTQALIDHCANSTTNDALLLTYIEWFEKNGTYMKTTQIQRSELVRPDQCLRPYFSRSKVKWIPIQDQHRMKHLSLYITMGVISVGIILGVIYLYRKNRFNLMTAFQRYRPLDRNTLVENVEDVGQQRREDDEIVMNLDEPPFNTARRS